MSTSEDSGSIEELRQVEQAARWFRAAGESGERWMLTCLDGSTDSGRARTGHVRCVS
ncbi:hypothetical protein FHR83_005938 [Actinoplanes campanulatus]|uniref:Uncharacterized protein n=1 Tax=Actinoplanes campanulatus TaxID=113559 RepID=A0A7W5FH29_9ACTN|nr:hypothetical protein [Actinoplanes campanulatus]MBB3098243.1 hypothetical protein [Actinoplanes campanulatus]GGN34769.1 hypothetical protein GCM10010109_58120 [Actinoplanes campanulatus]GID38798.1 hypothetical protein Aca09nite_53040 [Actinoplanes campanulatus]